MQRWGLLTAVVVIMTLLAASIAVANHGSVSLGGSNFEIDTDANLKLDHNAPSIDWATVAEVRTDDEPTGSGDDSFTQGASEDTPNPAVSTGSIPPNKSDLKTFGVYKEAGGTAGYLHLFWSRVQDPKGTTNMDFEFNKNKCDPTDVAGSVCSTNGVTPARSIGDLLIIYDLSKGGTVPSLGIREWDGSKWGTQTDLTASNKATGSINSSTIPEGESDGLGQLDPRTFGEATVDLSAVFQSGQCRSFGSAYLKSRSSDSFTSALKDFIKPQVTTIGNCGTVIIRKATVPATTDSFGFTSNISTQPATDNSAFSVVAGSPKTINNVLAGSYTVTENDPSPDYALTGINCGASTVPAANRTASVASRNVVFTIAADQILDCTFTNTKQKSNPSASTMPSVVPQDSATVSGLATGGSIEGAANKELTFSLWADATCTDTQLYTKTVTVTDNAMYATDNSGLAASNGYTITADGTYYWKVVYTGDSLNNPFTIVCGAEQVEVDLTGHPAP
jgi:hypothetical protein